MLDVQNQPAPIPLKINQVGVRNLTLPLVVCDRSQGYQHTVASIDLGVELPSAFKGTHMSRFIEALEGWNEHLSYQSLKNLLSDIKGRLCARRAYASFAFTYFVKTPSPVIKADSISGYVCRLTGELREGSPLIFLDLTVPVMSVCPCSKAISSEGAHSQRVDIRLRIEMNGFAWIEEFIDIARKSGSSPVYPLLKREDEKFVTETAFASPYFVEDIVRNVAAALDRHPHVRTYRVEVESYESIHAHNAFAVIESGVQEPAEMVAAREE